MIDHWQFFNYREIIREAKARLVEARQHGRDVGTDRDTLEYWTAWCSHANAASCLIPAMREELDTVSEAMDRVIRDMQARD